jgi:DNA repair protein RadC
MSSVSRMTAPAAPLQPDPAHLVRRASPSASASRRAHIGGPGRGEHVPRMATIAAMPHAQRPRERLLSVGPEALSDAELLAVLLGTGGPGTNALRLADHLLTDFGGPDGLGRAAPQELARHLGMGPAKALRLVAAFGLAQRLGKPGPRTELRSAADIAEVVRPWLANARRERVVVVVSDGALRLRRAFVVTEGSSDECLLPVREVLTAVLLHDGAAFAVAHNHPSGQIDPSYEDTQITASLLAGAEAVGLDFLGHLVIAGHRWTTCPVGSAPFSTLSEP